MKRSFILVSLFFSVILFNSSLYSQEKQDPWPELTAFHIVMAETFHPSEQGDLAPIKERSGEMAQKATALAGSKIPAEYNTKAVSKSLKKLKKESINLDKLVKSKAADQALTNALKGVHDTFHSIMGACSHEGGH